MPNKKKVNEPIENHRTAAWAHVEQTNKISQTSHPNLQQAINAKEYVDDNEK